MRHTQMVVCVALTAATSRRYAAQRPYSRGALHSFKELGTDMLGI